jgi:hypothetical protein
MAPAESVTHPDDEWNEVLRAIPGPVLLVKVGHPGPAGRKKLAGGREPPVERPVGGNSPRGAKEVPHRTAMRRASLAPSGMTARL